MRRGAYEVEVTAIVVVDDVLEEASDEALLAEIERRKLEDSRQSYSLVELAYQSLMRGDTAEALVLLDRHLHPFKLINRSPSCAIEVRS